MDYQIGRLSPLRHHLGTPLIGRAAECAALERLVLVDRASLISITGPGGVGKTRLALQLAGDLHDRFRDGSAVAFLASTSDHRLVPLAVARALDIKLSGNLPPLQEIANALADRELLLIVDTFEHVMPAARMLPPLLEACPGVVIVVTSRSTLALPGEVVFRVAPLVAPLSDEPLAGAERARWYDAVALFEARARAASSEFALTDTNADAVAQICRRLDGLPLAIELAAARTRALPPKLMLRHLEERREAPGSGARDAQARHRTMRDAIAWSYDLLTPDDQALFRFLSVFRGSFTAADATGLVWLREGETRGGSQLRDRVAALARASLLMVTPETGREPGYVMLGVLREFGNARLRETGEEAAAQRAHALWVAAQIGDDRSRSELFDRIDALRGEIRTAVAWAMAAPEPDLAGQLLQRIHLFWLERGLYQELRGWLEGVLQRWPDERAPRFVPLALSRLAVRQGELPRALALAERAFELAFRAGDQSAIADAALAIAIAEGRLGRVERSQAMAHLAMASLRETGDRERLADAMAELAHLAVMRGDLAEARLHAESALEYWQSVGQPQRAINMLDILSLVARLRGDNAHQSALAHRSLELTFRVNDPYTIASGLWTAAAIAAERGCYLESARFYGAEEALRTAIGFAVDPGYREERDASIAAVKAALGAHVFVERWETGRALDASAALDEAVSFLGRLSVYEQAVFDAEAQALRGLGLSERQIDVLRLIAKGKSDREIADVLAISARTVSKHVEAILIRMDTRTRSGAAAIAARLGADSSTPFAGALVNGARPGTVL